MKKGKKIIFFVIISIPVMVTIIPLYVLVINSFKTASEAARFSLSLPKIWSITSNYIELYEKAHIDVALMNTLIISTTSVVIIIFLAIMAAYGIQRSPSKLNNILYKILLLGMIIPIPIINIYMTTNQMGLNKSLWGIIVVLAVVNLSVAVFLYVGFLKSIPVSLDEAAMIDGASPMRILFKIILPLTQPITATILIISFVAVWNDFAISVYYLTNPKKYTLVITSLIFAGQKSSDWNLVFADIVVTCLPMIILYILLQKYIINGMTSGSVKG